MNYTLLLLNVKVTKRNNEKRIFPSLPTSSHLFSQITLHKLTPIESLYAPGTAVIRHPDRHFQNHKEVIQYAEGMTDIHPDK